MPCEEPCTTCPIILHIWCKYDLCALHDFQGFFYFSGQTNKVWLFNSPFAAEHLSRSSSLILRDDLPQEVSAQTWKRLILCWYYCGFVETRFAVVAVDCHSSAQRKGIMGSDFLAFCVVVFRMHFKRTPGEALWCLRRRLHGGAWLASNPTKKRTSIYLPIHRSVDLSNPSKNSLLFRQQIPSAAFMDLFTFLPPPPPPSEADWVGVGAEDVTTAASVCLWLHRRAARQ